MAKRRIIRILMLVSGKKKLDQHYSVFAGRACKTLVQGLQFRWSRDTHITISGSSRMHRNVQKELSKHEKGTRVDVRLSSVHLDVVVCLCPSLQAGGQTGGQKRRESKVQEGQ